MANEPVEQAPLVTNTPALAAGVYPAGYVNTNNLSFDANRGAVYSQAAGTAGLTSYLYYTGTTSPTVSPYSWTVTTAVPIWPVPTWSVQEWPTPPPTTLPQAPTGRPRRDAPPTLPEWTNPTIDEAVSWALTSAEREELDEKKCLTIPSLLPGRQYRIPHTEGSMVEVLTDGIKTKRLCLQPADNWLTDTRWLVLQMLMIRANERQYLRKAVHWNLETIVIQNAYETQDRPQFQRLAALRRRARQRAERTL